MKKPLYYKISLSMFTAILIIFFIDAMEFKVTFRGNFSVKEKARLDISKEQEEALKKEMDELTIETLRKMENIALKYASVLAIQGKEPVLSMDLKMFPEIVQEK